MKSEAPELLTVTEVAELMRTSKNAIYLAVERGNFPGVVRLGRRLLFRRDDVRAHMGLPVAEQKRAG